MKAALDGKKPSVVLPYVQPQTRVLAAATSDDGLVTNIYVGQSTPGQGPRNFRETSGKPPGSRTGGPSPHLPRSFWPRGPAGPPPPEVRRIHLFLDRF